MEDVSPTQFQKKLELEWLIDDLKQKPKVSSKWPLSITQFPFRAFLDLIMEQEKRETKLMEEKKRNNGRRKKDELKNEEESEQKEKEEGQGKK